MDYSKLTKKQLIELLMAKEEHTKLTSDAVYTKHLQKYGKKKQEYFLGVYLNGAGDVMSVQIVTIGLANRTLVHPREVFAPALEQRATAVIIAHNHPSGRLVPSGDDYDITESLKNAGRILGIRVLDHIIFSDLDYYSMAENNDMYFD